MVNRKIYSTGGPVQASGGIYITRKADDDLLALCREGEYVSLLASRQVGKSSLMYHTAEQLAKENIHSAIVDLQGLGIQRNSETWYLGVLTTIRDAIEIQFDVVRWWRENGYLGEEQRFVQFFRDVLLTKVSERVVIFFDEIDTILGVPFADNFLAAVRSIFNARVTTQAYERLSFVFIGTASVTDFIRDPNRTPFNVGTTMDLMDFTFEETLPLSKGLDKSEERARHLLGCVYEWTDGHPYLTQKLCHELSKIRHELQESDVDATVEQFFLGGRGRRDNNLQFVQDKLLQNRRKSTLLKLYNDVLDGQKIDENNQSWKQNALRLSGIVKTKEGYLFVRNKIYQHVFNKKWVRDNTPRNLTRNLGIAFFTIVTIIFLYDFVIASIQNAYTRRFVQASTPAEQVTSLAHIFKLRGILFNTEAERDARELFYGLNRSEQIRLFSIVPESSISSNPRDLVLVVRELYVTFADTDPASSSTDLLNAMIDALSQVKVPKDDPLRADINSLAVELKHWVDARQSSTVEDALNYYTLAINTNSENPATHYERARLYVSTGEYDRALIDLNLIFSMTKGMSRRGKGDDITPTPIPAVATTPTLPFSGEPTVSTPVVGAVSPPVFSDEGYQSNFYTYIRMTSAIRSLFSQNNELLSVYNANREEFSNLGDLGFLPPFSNAMWTAIAMTQRAKTVVTTSSSLNVTFEMRCAIGVNGPEARTNWSITGGVPPYYISFDGSPEMSIISSTQIALSTGQDWSYVITSADGQRIRGEINASACADQNITPSDQQPTVCPEKEVQVCEDVKKMIDVCVKWPPDKPEKCMEWEKREKIETVCHTETEIVCK